MKKLCVILLIVFLCVTVVGMYRGWFAFSSGKQPESNKVDISLTVDPDKVKEDADSVKEKAGELTEKIIDSDHSGESQASEPQN